MNFVVSFTSLAEKDLVSTLEYITEILNAPISASNLLKEIEEKIEMLSENPFINQIETDDYLSEKSIRHINGHL